MPVFDRKNQKASGSLTDDLMELIQDIRRQLRKFHNLDTDWIKEYLEDKETDLLLDPTVSEYEEIRDNLETPKSASKKLKTNTTSKTKTKPPTPKTTSTTLNPTSTETPNMSLLTLVENA